MTNHQGNTKYRTSQLELQVIKNIDVYRFKHLGVFLSLFLASRPMAIVAYVFWLEIKYEISFYVRYTLKGLLFKHSIYWKAANK